MAFELYKPGPGGGRLESFIASGAIAKGDVVKLVAAASATGPARVSVIAGGAGGTDFSYGVAVNAAADTGEVLVIPHEDGQVWKADAAANCDNTKIGDVATYLAATTLLVTTAGSITNNGNRVIIIGYEGLPADKKYLVKFRMGTTLLG